MPRSWHSKTLGKRAKKYPFLGKSLENLNSSYLTPSAHSQTSSLCLIVGVSVLENILRTKAGECLQSSLK